MMKALPLLALVLSVPFLSAYGFGYEDAVADGTVMPGIGAGNLLLGGAMAIGYGEPTSVLLNPANLGRVSAPGIEICVGPAIVTENVEDSIGLHSRSYLSLGPTSLATRIPAGRSLTLGAGLARVSDVSYDGRHYLAENPLIPGYITGAEALEASGGLWEAVAGCSYRVARWVSLGVSAGPRFGSADLEYAYDDRVGDEDSVARWGWDESGFCVHAGATFPFGLNSASVAWTSGSDHYPPRVAAGAILHSGGTAEDFSIGVEGEIRDPGEKNTFIGRLSGRFSPNPGFILGGALSFSDRGSESSRSNLGFAMGTAITIGRAVLRGGFMFESSSRRTTAFGYEGFDTVTDKVGSCSVGLDWTL